MVHPTTVTLALDQLEKRDLLQRTPHPTDRRTILASLTPAGRELLDQATRSLAEAEYGLPGIGEELSIQLTGMLHNVRARIGDTG
jgi:DNA-binding MarR family transcriptional regulator